MFLYFVFIFFFCCFTYRNGSTNTFFFFSSCLFKYCSQGIASSISIADSSGGNAKALFGTVTSQAGKASSTIECQGTCDDITDSNFCTSSNCTFENGSCKNPHVTDCSPSDDVVISTACKCASGATTDECATTKFCWTDNTCNDAAKVPTCEESAIRLDAECRCSEETCAVNKFCTPENECLAFGSMATSVRPCESGKIAGYNKDKFDRTCCESCSRAPTNCVELIDMAAKEDGCYSDCTKAHNAAGIIAFLNKYGGVNCTSEQIQKINDYNRPPSAPSPASPSPSSTSIYKTVASTPSVEDDEDEFIFNDSLSTGGGKVMIWKMFLIGMAGVLVLSVV